MQGFALYRRLMQEKYNDKPEYADVYILCKVLSVLKKDVLGQDLDAEDILKVLLNDYDENEEKLLKSKKYIEDMLKKEV